MSRFKVTVTEITDLPSSENQTAISPTIEIYSQTLPEINLPRLIKTLNPEPRRRRATVKKEGS